MRSNSVTLKIRKSHLFIFLFLIILAVTAVMLMNAYSEMKAGMPEPLTDTENIRLIQLEAPEENAMTAVISTTEGDMTVILYREEAPNAVSIFRSAAENGQYDGITAGLYELGSVFTLDVPDLETPYAAELHKNLWPFKGALCMNENEDIIFINTVEFSDEDREYLSAEGELYEVRSAFLEHGGVPNYARKYTVFGQIAEGMEVMEKIAGSPSESVITVTHVEIVPVKGDE